MSQKFRYQCGQRPLDGYTLKRGVGRGGFGEVYLAVSDGGKEVALKVLHGNVDAELRGVAHCLNLKHPNLVALYDLRRDADDTPWVVMEYVDGETLAAHIDRHPQGLPADLVREWFAGLARAVGYLHDHGIIHRDLKPGNIFIEHGVVKVGDYGLTKSISTSQGQAQTHSVGTVAYMAPEIGKGKYGKSVDLYAAAIVLYEMLTGEVPFSGQSAHEILVRHLLDAPDLSRVPEPFVPILKKALAKDPEQRYVSTSELARAVEATGGPPPSALAAAPPPGVTEQPEAAKEPGPLSASQPGRAFLPRRLVGELCGSLALAVPLVVLGTLGWATVATVTDLPTLGTFFFLGVLACWAVLVPAKWWTARPGSARLRRAAMLLLGSVVGLAGLWLDGWTTEAAPAAGRNAADLVDWLLPGGAAAPVGWLMYFAVAFAVLRWWRLADRHRPSRFSVAPVLAAGFWGIVLLLLARPQPGLAVGVLVLLATVVQLVSPWEPRPRTASKRLRLEAA